MFGLARNGAERAARTPVHSGPAPAPKYADRRDLLQKISDFLLDHELEVNAANLALAQTICSGGDDRLGHQTLAPQSAEPPALPDDPGFEAVLEREARATGAAGALLSIAVCNIDRFAVITQTHGRDTGERVIQAIVRVLQRIAGPSCHIARHGGEAFVLLFRGMGTQEARDKLDEARASFARRKLIDRDTRLAIGSVTFSAGVADVLAGSDPQAALQAAGEALSQARDEGHNRIVIADKADVEKSSPLGGGGSPQG